MQIKNMAAKITKKNYSLAIALLDPIVATHPPANLLGAYMVINEHAPHRPAFIRTQMSYGRRSGGRTAYDEFSEPAPVAERVVTLQNNWMPEEAFRKQFKFLRSEIEGEFVEIERIPLVYDDELD